MPRPSKRRSADFVTKSQLKKILSNDTEVKHIDDFVNSLDINTTSSVTDMMANIARGTSDTDNRIGDAIKLKSLNIKYFVERTVTTGTNPDIVRVILFQWKMHNVDDSPGATLATVLGSDIPPLGNYAYDDRQKFKILYDKFHAMGGTPNDSSILFREVNISHDLLKRVQFDGATANGFNKLYLGVYGATASGTSDSVMSAVWRIKYTDS